MIDLTLCNWAEVFDAGKLRDPIVTHGVVKQIELSWVCAEVGRKVRDSVARLLEGWMRAQYAQKLAA